MADNSTRLDGGGVLETLASDDIGGVKYQRVKIAIGADGAAVDVEPPDADAKAASKVMPSGLVYCHSDGTWYRARGAGAGDGLTPAQVGLTALGLFNESTVDRQRGNTQGSLLASAARTAVTNSALQTNYNARGVMVILNVTAASGSGGLQVVIVGQPAGSGYALNATPTPVTTTGLFVYELYPGIGAASGGVTQRTSGTLPRTWFVQVQVGNATSYTYQLDYALIV